MIKLRDYQLECLDVMDKEKDRGIVKQLIHLPTGVGKTIIAAELVKRTDGRSLFLAHRDELIRQAYDKMSMVCPELSMGIVKAKIRKLRMSGLAKGGIYSVENIAFKVLRRNDYLQKLSSLRIVSYDKNMSLKEE